MKSKDTSLEQLDHKIAALKKLEKQQLLELRQSAQNVIHHLSPVNLLKDTVQKVTASPDLRLSVMDTALGIGAGILGKRLFVGRSSNLLKKTGGLALEFLLSNFVRKQIPLLRRKRLNGMDTD
ncbi:MAG: hypothetical protein IPG86_07770 [Chitinophagaceae bacterium]|nr:hypothetical protein [Chitinophagaceae bacterium]